ncbi:MAG: exonuclease domain-containing protein [Leptothrix sp. (in: b-proteobacteria)]
MKNTDRRLVRVISLAVLGLMSWTGLTMALVWTTLAPLERQQVAAVLGARLDLVGLLLIAACGVLAFALHKLLDQLISAPAILLDQARALVGTDVARTLAPQGNLDNQALTQVINELVLQRSQLREEMAEKVREASHTIEQERSRLAALMSELTQSVVVCNLDGRVLLYNNRARMQFRALSKAPALAGGAELIGLGRSIYSVFDRKLVAHALENIQQRMQRGAAAPSAQFVTATQAGQLLRVQMAPVRSMAPAEASAEAALLSGFVLMLDNITHEFEQESQRDQLLHGLTEGSRGALANLQAALDMLEYPDLDEAMRARFHGVIRDEVGNMTRRIQALTDSSAQDLKTRWPLEDMLGADLIAAALKRIESQCAVRAASAEVDSSLWLKVDSFSLLQALLYLSHRLVDEFEVRLLQLRLTRAGERAQLDLIWIGQALSTETVMNWEMEEMRLGSDSSPLTVRDVVARHGGEFWFERERVRHQAFFRFLLPLASPQLELETAAFLRNESRPEYYDFDLFQVTEQSRALDDRRLSDLAYTVFDTETTGLNPSQGDEIIQIGAVRIVNGKLLRHEGMDQLVDPGCIIPAASIPIHGITQDMVRGQPDIDAVLPAFHAFAQDTVLVAHNAAFDMRFLQLKEQRTGLAFEQPVLDTLLLSAVVHPNQESHRLEAIAERFGITVLGRHTALGDAIVTAEVFLKLVALLQDMGIHTLGQAREAAQKTYYARLKY